MNFEQFEEERKEKNRQKTKKHYHAKIKVDTITFKCEFCNEYHTRQKDAYADNINKNGRFICINENGSIIGKLPKLHLRKKNEYESIGKKQCDGKDSCGRILPLDCFSPGKNKCKECRAKHYKNKYHENKKV